MTTPHDHSSNPLHGVTLERMLTEMVEQLGWEKMGRRVKIACFTSDPSISSSLKFLRRTPWARAKVEAMYLFMVRTRRPRSAPADARANAPALALILPGIGNSGPDHWQSHWERQDPTCVRVMQDEWDAPACAVWIARLDDAIADQDEPVVLVGHSSACALVAHWAMRAKANQHARVLGALLVAPSDPTGPEYPVGPFGFAPVPLAQLPFPSIVVASDDDVYVSAAVATQYATAWGSRLVMLTGAGHINAASGLGAWPDGYALLASLR